MPDTISRSCARYEHLFTEFGEKYQNPSTLTVGMVNSATNELPRPLVMKSDPPHVLLVPGNRTSPYQHVHYFFDDIGVGSLEAFVKQYGTHDLVQNTVQVDDEEETGEKTLAEDQLTDNIDIDMVGGESLDDLGEQGVPLEFDTSDDKGDGEKHLDMGEIKDILAKAVKDAEHLKDEL